MRKNKERGQTTTSIVVGGKRLLPSLFSSSISSSSSSTSSSSSSSSSSFSSLTIVTVLIISSFKNVICQNDYYEDLVTAGTGEDIGSIVHHHHHHHHHSQPAQNPSAAAATAAIGNTRLESLDVICGKEYMTVRAEFNGPFNGIIFSKGTYGQSKCVYVKPHSGLTHVTFNVRYDECGTKPDLQGKYFENTIVIQYGTDIIEAYDEAKRLRCEWFEAYEKPATFRPAIPVADLDIIEMNFQGDEIDCWMSIQEGKGPWSNEINRIVTVGQPLTIVVAINDKKNQFDMKVKSCFAHDGVKAPIYLIDEEGCILRPKMISPFQKLRNVNSKATLISYAQFLAFKFPDSVDVQIQCTVEVCRHGCVDTCDTGHNSNQIDRNSNNNNNLARTKLHDSSNRFQIENVTTRFSMDKDDLLESANTNREPVVDPSGETSDTGDSSAGMNNFNSLPELLDEEKQNYLELIADYLHRVDQKPAEANPGESDLGTGRSPPPVAPLTNANNAPVEQPHQHAPAPPPPPPMPMPSPKLPPPKRIPSPPPPPPLPPRGPGGIREPVAQVLNIPLSPIYSIPLPLTMPPPQPLIPAKGLGNLLNGIKLFNKKPPVYIPQLLSNYFGPKRNVPYVPNDNFELFNHPAATVMSNGLRTKRYIANNDKQGEIGLKKGFQVVTTLDLSFSPNQMSPDQMLPVFEGKPEAIVYGVCFSSLHFIYMLTVAFTMLISGIVICICVVCRIERLKHRHGHGKTVT